MKRAGRLGLKAGLGTAFLIWLGALAAVGASRADSSGALVQPPERQAPSTPQVTTPSPPAKGNAYVGNESCLGCHDDQRSGYERTLHHAKIDPRSPEAKQGCETCHGPGSLHADDPDHVDVVNDFKVMSADAVTETCGSCHNRGEHALWIGSSHERRDVSCTSCHTLHNSPADTGFLRAKTQTDTCATCHREKASKIDRSGHMPLREGKMECSSCHNPHGSTNVSLLTKGDSVAEMCTSCHADKRGPYVFEHAPSRDGCVTCHDPHGSSNERMLVVRTPMLCQRCHVATRHPSTIYDQALINTSVRVYARSCVTCHANIHGSNHPGGRFFLR